MSAEFWWIWMIIGAFFVIAEILTAGFFLLWFGVGAGVAGLLALAGLGLGWQLTTFIVISFALFAVSRRFADRFTKPQPPGIGADRFVGRTGVVVEEIDNKQNTGKVRFDQEEWRAHSGTGDSITTGDTVEVTKVEGTHVVVRRIQKGD